MDVKGDILLQLFHKNKLRNGTKTFLEQNFSLFILKFKKSGFSAPLIHKDNAGSMCYLTKSVCCVGFVQINKWHGRQVFDCKNHGILI